MPASVQATQFRRELLNSIDSSTLLGADVLRQLSRKAKLCVLSTQGSQRRLAYVVAHFIESLSEHFDDRAVPASETLPVFEDVAQLLLTAASELVSENSTSDICALIDRIIELEIRIVEPLVPN